MLSRKELHRLRGPAQMREEEIEKMIGKTFITLLCCLCFTQFLFGNESNKKQRLRVFVGQIEKADLPLQIKPLDLYRYLENKDRKLPVDTAFAKSWETPYKIVEYNKNFVLITYLSAADPIPLVLKTFNSNGEIISSIRLRRGVGKSGPEYEAYTYITLNKENEIIKNDSIITNKIDDKGYKIPSTIKIEKKTEIYSIGNDGSIVKILDQ